MGILGIGAQIMSPVIYLIKTCIRSIVYHPFFVGLFIFLFFLNKSFPFLFSLFVYASPIFVSTAFLLGTLLSFGKPNLPEIENEKENRPDSSFVSLKTGISINATSVGEKYSAKRYSNGKEIEILEEKDRNTLDFEPLIDEELCEVKSQNTDSEFEIKSERNWVVLEDYCLKVPNKNRNLESKTDSSLSEHIEPNLGENIESSEEDDEREESSNDESDGDESVIPLIDELDPLLDEKSDNLVNKSQESSNYGTDESDNDDDDDTSEEEEFGDMDNDDENDERGKIGKEGENKSVITWSEDDRKNVANLGTIELERNERLESVIARRRWQRLMAEKNLIDLNNTDFPTNNNNNVAPISTKKQNPFDLPSIPGSAPSLQPRSNPFDLPFHTNEDRSEPLIDISHQGSLLFRRHESFSVGPAFSVESLLHELSIFPSKEASFRRHESFNMGPSIFGSKLKPYFVPEKVNFEGTSFSSLDRISSEVNESMASSLSSDGDKDSDGDFVHEPKLISDLDHVDHGSESSENDYGSELGENEENGVERDENEIKLGDVESKFGDVESKNWEIEGKFEDAESKNGEIESKIGDFEGDCVSGDDVDSMISSSSSMVELAKEPVYDSSPHGIQKDLSFSSISSEIQVEFSETGDAPVLVKRAVSFVKKESNLSDENIGFDTSEENKSVVADSVDKVVFLHNNGDDIGSSSIDEKVKVSMEIIEEEQLPSSDESRVGLSSEAPDELQEETSISKTEAVGEETISHGQEQENIKETGNSENNEEIKRNSDSNIEKENNLVADSTDVSSMSYHAKDEKKKKKKKSNKSSSSSSSSSSSASSSDSE